MKKTATCFPVFFVLILISCGTNKYVLHAPDTPITPFFKEQGDMKVAVGRIWNRNSNKAGLTTQAA